MGALKATKKIIFMYTVHSPTGNFVSPKQKYCGLFIEITAINMQIILCMLEFWAQIKEQCELRCLLPELRQTAYTIW